FFFSSRRRHTRSKRDWSSDVCSSDLDPAVGKLPGAGELLLGPVEVSAFPGVVTELVGLHDLAAQAPVLAVQATGAGDQIPAGTQIGRASCRESGRVPGAAGPAEERAK